MISKLLFNTFLKISTHAPRPYTGRPYEAILADQKQYMFPLYAHYYKQPLLAVQGYKQFLYDQKGREYIDLMGGISCMNIGHSHPRVSKIFKQEAQKLANISSHYIHPYQGQYAEKLCKELGHGLDTVFFFNSGSQSNDFAYNLAKAYTKNNTIVALRYGYHGTAGHAYHLTSLGTWTNKLHKGNALERLACPNSYRSAHSSVQSLIHDAHQQLESSTHGKIAGAWLEPVLGAGGVIPLTKKYAQSVYELVKKMGGLYISDEVQTGFGRIGKQMWGYKWLEVKPDIVVMAKAIANGIPFSAIVTRRQIADSLIHNYFPSYCGGPLQYRVGMEVLDILKEEKLGEQADNVGGYLIKQFKRIQKNFPYIGDVRGKGMMVAVEFVEDQKTKKENTKAIAHFLQKGKEAGVLFGKGGAKGNIIRMLGPLCLSQKSAQKVIGVFEQISKTYQQ